MCVCVCMCLIEIKYENPIITLHYQRGLEHTYCILCKGV